jgi:hypothetical protein
VLVAIVLAAAVPAIAESRIPRVLDGAYEQVGVTRYYDGRYQRIGFPGGDVSLERGVCTDVIVRAYRHAKVDLQLLVNEDMTEGFASYPRLWGLSRPDPNIDHRRVPNLATFFTRHGEKLPVSKRAEDYRAGDLVTWRLASGVPHIGLVADREANGRPLIIHNIGAGALVEDVLFAYEITGHYRYDPGAEVAALSLPGVAAEEAAEVATVRAYFAAYNAHDIDGVVKRLHPEFVWLSVDGDKVSEDARGPDAIRTMLTGYFKGLPTTRSEIETISALGPWVSVRERAHWKGKDGGARSQASLSVYEVRDGLLRRVWYYPSVK